MKLVVNVSGLGVVKRIITHLKTEKTYKIVSEFLIKNSLMLIQNPYGNYAIQVAIDVRLLILINILIKKWGSDFSLKCFQNFICYLVSLSMQKYSSNVLEKCFEYGKENLVSAFVQEVCQTDNITSKITSG